MTDDFLIGLAAGILSWPAVTLTLWAVDRWFGCAGDCGQGRRDCDCSGDRK